MGSTPQVLCGWSNLPAQFHSPSLGRGFRAQEGGVQPVWGAVRAQPSLGTLDVPKTSSALAWAFWALP